jgi:hypothetical protein
MEKELNMKQVVDWESEAVSNRRVRLLNIEHFDARGKHCVYGRRDIFTGRGSFNMTIWKDKTGRLLVRFWSRKIEADWLSYELIGIILPEFTKTSSLPDDQWIPQVLRKEYDNWILSEF